MFSPYLNFKIYIIIHNKQIADTYAKKKLLTNSLNDKKL